MSSGVIEQIEEMLMSKRHFEDYLNKVYNSYLQLEKVYNTYLEECQKDMVEPERLQSLEEMIKPVKDSYNTLRYIKYLLDMPNRESKGARYINQNKRLLNSIDDKYKKEAVLRANEETINKATAEISKE